MLLTQLNRKKVHARQQGLVPATKRELPSTVNCYVKRARHTAVLPPSLVWLSG